MNAIDEYLNELATLLQVRGTARRRLLRETRDHLEDASADFGSDEAVRRFGDAAALAASFGVEVATRRACRATLLSVLSVLAVGGSTLAVLHGSSAAAPAAAPWTIVFFGAAQTAAVCIILAALQAAEMRSGRSMPPDVALLCRRNNCGLISAGVTLFAAGAALPGHASAVLLLGGPVLGTLAAIMILRAHSVVRRLGARGHAACRSPLADLSALVRVPLPQLSSIGLLLPSALAASTAAFLWDRGEHAAIGTALAAASIEAGLVALGFALLGPVLGLRPDRHRAG